jgi:hypothetical protein
MRDSHGRFCKVVPQPSAKRPLAQTTPVGVEGVAEGEGGETSLEQRIIDYGDWFNRTGVVRVYYHKNLLYPIEIKFYDHYNNLLR